MIARLRRLAGALTVLFATCGSAVLQAQTTPAGSLSSIEITYKLVAPAPLPPTWDVLLRPVGSPTRPATRYAATAGKPLQLHLAPGSSWEISAEVPGFWVARKTLAIGSGAATQQLELTFWPLGKISGHVSIQQQGVAPPAAVLVKTVAAPAVLKRPPMPPGALTCPVDKGGSWSCSLPAATFDLVVTAEGFIPQYRWGVAVSPAKTVSLGAFRLERGGSLAAWVAVENGALDTPHAVAKLSPLAACDSDLPAVLELSRTAIERPVGPNGFLQMTGLPPGSYALEVRQPGLAPARVASLRVDPQVETFLAEPLLLTRPVALEFEITPPTDERGEPWRTQVTRRIEGDPLPAPFVYDGKADSAGRFTVEGQSPGRFRVVVLDTRGNRLHSEPERTFDGSALHRIELHQIAIEGRLRLGSEPLPATLWFGGQHGERRVKMEADEKGHFAGRLPSQDLWVVDVEGTDPPFRVRTRTEIHPDRSGRATVSIDLPDTRVFGHILDERGQPATRAYLTIASAALDQHVEADPKGGFDVHGLPEGLLALLASDGAAGQSERTLVNTTTDRAVGPIELRLRPIRRLNGKVLSSLGPVAGANVVALADWPAAGAGQALTGAGGAFTLEVPANLATLTAVVKAPGFGTRAFPIVPAEKPVSLTLSAAAGEVAIALPRTLLDLQRESLRVTLFQDGVEIPTSLLREDVTTAEEGEAPILRLSHLAPGSYSACIAPKQVESKGALDRAPQQAAGCDSGQLVAGSSLALTLREKD